MATRNIYHVYFCDDELGDIDAFFEFDMKLKLITSWSLNDANYRNEYMSPLFLHLGVAVRRLPMKYEKTAKDLLREWWG